MLGGAPNKDVEVVVWGLGCCGCKEGGGGCTVVEIGLGVCNPLASIKFVCCCCCNCCCCCCSCSCCCCTIQLTFGGCMVVYGFVNVVYCGCIGEYGKGGGVGGNVNGVVMYCCR